MIRALVLSGMLLAGCATAPTPLGQQSPEGDWLLVRIDGQRADGEGRIHFDPPGGGISGQAPCNGFGSIQYTLAGARLLTSGGMITTAGCRDEPRAHRERVLMDAVLWKSPHFVIYGDRMMLTGPGGEVVELRREPR
ncbi:MAG TPA: META domain-containing protein [Caulobacteraceae bacterium]|nr:META domain-containing protein [Caulobacteraceae bacterium]